MKLIWITDAKYMKDYTLKLFFNDGEEREFDFSSLWGTHPMYDSIRNMETFKKFEMDGWSISWLGGKVDVSPEYLYFQSKQLENNISM